MNAKVFIFIISLITVCNVSFSQNVYTLLPQKSEISISGTSSVHDWTMHIKSASGSFLLKSENQFVNNITDVNFTCPASGIVSHNSIMDKKAHNALKADAYPEIKFNMRSIEITDSLLQKFNGHITGDLFIAGKKMIVNIPFKGSANEQKAITISGNQKLRMTDFGIEPPKAMLGALTTGDEVTILFNLEFIDDLKADR